MPITRNTDGSLSSVQAAVNASAPGDTVTLPPGSYTWSGALTLNIPITITATGIVSANPPSPPVTITHNNGAGNLFNWTMAPSGDAVLAGISFLPGSATGLYVAVGSSLSPSDGILILHDCAFSVPTFQLAAAVDLAVTGGLIYNCSFTCLTDGGGLGWGTSSGCIRVRSGYPWYNVSTFGALDATGRINLYVEDCTFFNIWASSVDTDDNGRLNIRHCHLINSGVLTHGITSTWGGRQIDFNNNQCEFRLMSTPNSAGTRAVNIGRWIWWRAGTGRVWGNSVDLISSSDWGTKPSWQAIDEPLTRAGTGNGNQCETQAMYPGTRWPGTGSDGTAHPGGQIVSPSFVDPIYIWGNSPGPNSDGSASWSTNDQSGATQTCFNGPTSAVFLLNRDIFLSAPANNPSAPYSPYAYPHPLRSAGPPRFGLAIADQSSVVITFGSSPGKAGIGIYGPLNFQYSGAFVSRSFPLAIRDSSSVLALGFHGMAPVAFPVRIGDTSTVLKLGFGIGLRIGVQIADISRVLALGYTIVVPRFSLAIGDTSKVVALGFQNDHARAPAPPAEDGPVIMPPYAGSPQSTHLNVPAHIAYKYIDREEGPWVMPPYAALFPPPEAAPPPLPPVVRRLKRRPDR